MDRFGHWHLNYSIDEQMIPYFGMHSAKQTNRAKKCSLWVQEFCTDNSHHYPYSGRQMYSTLSDEVAMICDMKVSAIVAKYPFTGHRRMMGFLRDEGENVQE